MMKKIFLLMGTVIVLLSPRVLRQTAVASITETECQEEVVKAEYINNCEFCDPDDDPTCDEHWNIRVICGGKVKKMKVLTRACGANPADPWNDSGWASFTVGGQPPAGNQGSGVIDGSSNLLIAVPFGSGGVFVPGSGCAHFIPDGGSMVVFTQPVLAQ